MMNNFKLNKKIIKNCRKSQRVWFLLRKIFQGMKNTDTKNYERMKKVDKNYEGQIPLYKY